MFRTQRRMTAVVESEVGGSKLLWSGDMNAVGTSTGLGGSKAQRLAGTQTWTSSKMSRSQNGGEVVGGGKVLLMGGKEEQGSKHTWPRRRDVSSLVFLVNRNG